VSDTRKVLGTRVRETQKALIWRWHAERTGTFGTVVFPLSAVLEIHPDSVVVEAWIAEVRVEEGALPEGAVI
jgi:hypothetical protein